MDEDVWRDIVDRPGKFRLHVADEHDGAAPSATHPSRDEIRDAFERRLGGDDDRDVTEPRVTVGAAESLDHAMYVRTVMQIDPSQLLDGRRTTHAVGRQAHIGLELHKRTARARTEDAVDSTRVEPE